MGGQGGGCPRPFTPGGGYWSRLAPECFARTLAIGQQSTAHIGTRRGRRGLGGRVALAGCAACRPPANPALKADLSRGQSKGDLFSAEAMRRLPGAVLERACPQKGAHPRGVTRAILNTGHGTNPRPPALWGYLLATGPGLRSMGATIRGAAQGAGGHGSAGSNCLDRLPKIASRFDGVNRPSDATWKQRLGLITLVASWDDIVVFRPFFFSSPHIPGKVGVELRQPANVRAPAFFLPGPIC